MSIKRQNEGRAYILREEQRPDYNWNIGDQLIHAGVVRLLKASGVEKFAFFDRKSMRPLPENGDASMIVYAGMPQFAASDRPNADDQSWAILRHRFPPPIEALNIGCGTGYALHSNRLTVAAHMAAERYNQWMMDAQGDVRFLTRDPITQHFLQGLGHPAELGICPSLMMEDANSRQTATADVAIALVNPDVKFDESQRNRLQFDFAELVQSIVAMAPDALVICQEPLDLEWAEAVGIQNCVLPKTLDAFQSLCGSAKVLISTRVHATVSAFTQGVDVLHFAIDGRSDLLTPLMACGLWKESIFDHSLNELLHMVRQASYGYGREASWRNVLDVSRTLMAEQFSAARLRNPKAAGEPTSLVLNPQLSSRMRDGDVAIITADRFQFYDGVLNDNILSFQLESQNGILVSGPYLNLAAGTYDVVFDLEWWGRTRSFNGTLIFDVAIDGEPVAAQAVSIRSLLTDKRLPRLRFDNPSRRSGIEFRIACSDFAAGLVLKFQGVFITFRA